MKKACYILSILILFACGNSKNEFSLTGTTQNLKKGTTIYLYENGKVLDSTKIINNKFIFNTVLPKSPLQVIVRTKNFSQYRVMWLENSTMTFDATDSDFRNAVVTGSDEELLSQNLQKEIKSLTREERLKKEMEFVKNHPNSLHSAYVLSVYTKTWGRDKTKTLFDKFSEENKSTQHGKKIAKYLEVNKNPKVGDMFVDFEMADTKGNIRKLSDIKAKLVLLEFWSSNCVFCRKENKNLVKTYNIYNKKGFEIFGVSEEVNKEDWLKAIEEDKLTWTQVSDLNKENNAFLIYGVYRTPDNFLIDEHGKIIDRDLRGDKLNKRLSELLD